MKAHHRTQICMHTAGNIRARAHTHTQTQTQTHHRIHTRTLYETHAPPSCAAPAGMPLNKYSAARFASPNAAASAARTCASASGVGPPWAWAALQRAAAVGCEPAQWGNRDHTAAPRPHSVPRLPAPLLLLRAQRPPARALPPPRERGRQLQRARAPRLLPRAPPPPRLQARPFAEHRQSRRHS
jgi:hypothetical protein